jgi:hypothetical protein
MTPHYMGSLFVVFDEKFMEVSNTLAYCSNGHALHLLGLFAFYCFTVLLIKYIGFKLGHGPREDKLDHLSNKNF